MFKDIRVFGVLFCILPIAMILGCSGAQHERMASGQVESLHPGYEVVYYPKIQPGRTLTSVANEMKSWSERGLVFVFIGDDHLKFNKIAWVKDSTVYDDRVEIEYGSTYEKAENSSFSWFFYELLNTKIVVEFTPRDSRGVYPYAIILPRLVTTFRPNSLSTAQNVADALFFLQQQAKNAVDKENKKVALFEPVAAEYRSMKIKPKMSEEQRRLVVQADALNQQKNYVKAIEQYQKAVELNPTSYPGAYFNLALLSAQTNRFHSAIIYMKHYLLLEPDAKDARTAQDKIYEWEFMIKK